MEKRFVVYEVRKATVSNGCIGCRRVIESAGRTGCPPQSEKKIKKVLKSC